MKDNLMFTSHLDAGRCREIGKELSGPLSQFRGEMNADVTYLVFRHDNSRSFDVVATDSDDRSMRLLVGESVTIENRLSTQVPQSVARIRMTSTMRTFESEVTSALVVPWRSAGGHAWLIVGNLGRSGVVANRARTPSRLTLAEQVRKAYRHGMVRGSHQLEMMFRDSIGRLVEAERTFDTQSLLQAIASTVRWFFNTSSAYVALPSAEPDKYAFVATERIRTADFRALSLGSDEGIGGLVRRKQQSVRTTNYADDPRLKHGPMRETIREGFKSAVCTPLWREGRLNGLLYIAERDFRAFSDIDVSLLEEFAGRSSEALVGDEMRRFHEERIRRAERDRLSEMLHDQVVSYLLDVGITARLTAAESLEPLSREALDRIQKNTQSCLDAIRKCIAGNEAQAPALVRHVAAELGSTPLKTGLRRTIIVAPAADSPIPLPAEVAGALRMIGQEALNNADRHSGGRTVRLTLDRVHDEIRLAIEDDGQGIAMDRFAELLDRKGHLGLQRMRSLASRAGGSCRFEQSVHGGLRVVTSLPLLSPPIPVRHA